MRFRGILIEAISATIVNVTIVFFVIFVILILTIVIINDSSIFFLVF